MGSICSSAWDAGCKLTGGFCLEIGERVSKTEPNDRVIITRDEDNVPKAFRWNKLKDGGTQRASLDQSDNLGGKRLNYLRGVRTKNWPKVGAVFSATESQYSAILFPQSPPMLVRRSAFISRS